MSYGLRFRSVSQSLGSTFDWFVPDSDMPDIDNTRGKNIYRDVIVGPTGNTFLYDKGKTKKWKLNFQDVSPLAMNSVDHCCSGWLGQKQITIIYFGTVTDGTAVYTPAQLASAGQCWGTGYFTMVNEPQELGLDLWTFSIEINEFGPNQVFN